MIRIPFSFQVFVLSCLNLRESTKTYMYFLHLVPTITSYGKGSIALRDRPAC